MFLNASTGAKASQDMAARFLAAKAAKAKAKAIANGEVIEVIPTKKPARKSSIKQVEDGTESTWLSEHHEKLRTDAIQKIQKAISKQEELKGALSTTLERLIEVAHARLQCSNERGMYRCTRVPEWKRPRRLHYTSMDAGDLRIESNISFLSHIARFHVRFPSPGVILSMKKVVACQGQQEHNSATLDMLEKLFLDIGSGDVKSEGHEMKIRKILALPLEMKMMSDDEMLKELDKLAANEAQ
jgi:hypothetical protein